MQADPLIGTGEYPVALPLFDAAALLGRYRWVELRLFEMTGRWAAQSTGGGAVRVHLEEMSIRHGWHAELFEDRLPVLDGVDPELLTCVPDTEVEALFGALSAGVTDPDPADVLVWGRLAGLHRVLLPRLRESHLAHLARTVPATDGPTVRALRLVIDDETEEIRAGTAILDRLAKSAEITAIAEFEEHLEALLTVTGPRVGLISWPNRPTSVRRA